MYLTEKTGSIYPPVLLHTMLDLSPNSDLQKFFASSLSKDIENKITDFQIALVLMVIIPALFGSVYFILLMRNRKNVEMQATSTE